MELQDKILPNEDRFNPKIGFFLPKLLTTIEYLLIFAFQNVKNRRTMDRLVEFIKTNDGLNETEAKAKLNLIYIKMNQSEI